MNARVKSRKARNPIRHCWIKSGEKRKKLSEEIKSEDGRILLSRTVRFALFAFVVTSPMTGYDWHTYYAGQGVGSGIPLLNPYWAFILIGWMPFWLYVLSSVLILENVPPMALLSYSVFWCIFMGQIDFLPLLGILILLRRRDGWAEGIAIILLLVKVQVGGLLALAVFFGSREKTKVLLVISSVLLVSLLAYPHWVFVFVQDLYLAQVGDFSSQPLNIALNMPYLLALFPFGMRLSGRRFVTFYVILGACVFKYFALYSLLPIVVMYPALSIPSWIVFGVLKWVN